ncbi:hypothetical protein CONPUDRAFT_154155 [Coniophora puteana RWD-64-598 SS2]|uniref:DRBM domain-containing protein n=1 Tax=Coniophora puteana (strain RWD-64-598) TaxID=741705 RepID=A0A5M3MSI3_CONPW|nr:uncharacterized protein CONPUDRAFT_154155 [Coniophora puteana RWD-64-598 SS2]EIW81625.1 hypothetical protein CONPUDRAFT_154155 [Coniophora puteana RWD-64-598 SS2]
MNTGSHHKMELNNFLQGLPNGSPLKASGANWIVGYTGPEHDRRWHAAVTIAGRTWDAEDGNKRDAQDTAAELALKELRGF